MPTPDPTKLAAAILKARGTDEYDALIVRTFESLAKAPEVAWKLLELADERACQATTKVGKNMSSARCVCSGASSRGAIR